MDGCRLWGQERGNRCYHRKRDTSWLDRCVKVTSFTVEDHEDVIVTLMCDEEEEGAGSKRIVQRLAKWWYESSEKRDRAICARCLVNQRCVQESPQVSSAAKIGSEQSQESLHVLLSPIYHQRRRKALVFACTLHFFLGWAFFVSSSIITHAKISSFVELQFVSA